MEMLVRMREELPEAFPVVLQLEDLQNRLHKVSGLASFSASISIRARRPLFTALETLEAFSGVVTSRLLATKYQDDSLRKYHSYLARDYAIAQQNIEGLRFPGFENHERLDIASIERRSSIDPRRLEEALQQVIKATRQQPSFECFLQPLSRDEICALSREGPAVCLNISHVGSEAFLISKNTIAAIPLPGLQRPDVEKNVKILAFNSNRRRRDASLCRDKEDGADGDKIKNHNPKLHSALLNLWNHAVQPALQALRLLRHDPKPKPLPRVRWVVSGITSLLPLHAAGSHTPGSTD